MLKKKKVEEKSRYPTAYQKGRSRLAREVYEVAEDCKREGDEIGAKHLKKIHDMILYERPDTIK